MALQCCAAPRSSYERCYRCVDIAVDTFYFGLPMYHCITPLYEEYVYLRYRKVTITLSTINTYHVIFSSGCLDEHTVGEIRFKKEAFRIMKCDFLFEVARFNTSKTGSQAPSITGYCMEHCYKGDSLMRL